MYSGPVSAATVNAWSSLERLRVVTQALPATFLEDDARAVIYDAEFVFARDSISLECLRSPV